MPSTHASRRLDWTSPAKEAVVRLMTNAVGPTRQERAEAIEALLPVLSGLIEATVESMTSRQVATGAGRLAQALREAAVIADAVEIIAGRRRP
jgi:hypothetical protein